MSDYEILTHSRLAAYRRCNRLEKLSYRDGYRPTRENEAARDGSLVHLGLETWTKTGGDAEAAFKAVEGIQDPFQKARVEELLLGYFVRWANTFDQYTVLEVEAQFEIPLINPETRAVSRTFRLAGKVDGILEGVSSGRKAVLEHKSTTQSIDSEADAYFERLAMDHQLSIYFLGGQSIVGEPIDEALYDVIRKPALRPKKATPEESRKYTAKGALYANQRDTDETPDEYRVRLRDEIAENPEKYYARKVIPRTMSQIEDFLFDAWQTAETLRESMRKDRAPRNPEACFQFGSEYRCAFWDVCANGVDPATSSNFRKLENVHEELMNAVEVA